MLEERYKSFKLLKLKGKGLPQKSIIAKTFASSVLINLLLCLFQWGTLHIGYFKKSDFHTFELCSLMVFTHIPKYRSVKIGLMRATDYLSGCIC